MRTVFDPVECTRLRQRIGSLTAATPARWGRMSAPQMICHLTDAAESVFAPSPPAGTGILSRFPVKQLVIYVLPWPKAKLKSPPDLLVTKPGDWAADVQRLLDALDCVAARDPRAAWPDSEVFGLLSRDQWGALLRTHFDHHLKQFGV